MTKESDKKNADFQRGWDAALHAAKAWHEGKAKQAMVQSTRTRFPEEPGTRGGGSPALRGTDRHAVAGRRLTPRTAHASGRLGGVRFAGAVGEDVHRGCDPALTMRHAGIMQAHLDAGQRAHERQIVEIAEMTDAEDPSLQSCQPGAQRHVVAVQDRFSEVRRRRARPA